MRKKGNKTKIVGLQIEKTLTFQMWTEKFDRNAQQEKNGNDNESCRSDGDYNHRVQSNEILKKGIRIAQVS